MAQQAETFDEAMTRLRERVRSGEFITEEATFDAELARVEALGAREVEAKEAEVAATAEFLRRRTAEKVAREALIAAGIVPRFIKTAVTLFLQGHRLEFAPDHDGEPGAVVISEDGPMTVESVASAWAHSDDAAPFRAPIVAPDHFAAQVRLIR
jgi:hypothetical protein